MTDKTDMDEPDRSSMPASTQADDQPPPSNRSGSSPSPNASPSPLAIEIEINDTSGTLNQPDLNALRDLTRRVLAQLPNAGSVRARIVNDHDMIQAHQQYCDLATTTDVLTFDLAQHETDPASKALDTDLIVCVDEARRQAHTRNHTHIHELLLYILHGVLHCLGYDDHTDQDYTRMHTREDQLLTSAGIGPLFHDQQAIQQETQS